MKPSHLQTPRTLADTTFVTGYYSANFKPKTQPKMDWQDRLVIWAGSIIGFALLVMVMAGVIQ